MKNRTITRVAALFLCLALLSALYQFTAGVTAEAAVSPETAELTAMLRFEESAMNYWLRIATDDEPPCDEPCIRDTTFDGIITGLLARCVKIEPDDVVKAPGYVAAQHQDSVRRLSSACADLQSAKAAHGSPSKTDTWTQAARQALSHVPK